MEQSDVVCCKYEIPILFNSLCQQSVCCGTVRDGKCAAQQLLHVLYTYTLLDYKFIRFYLESRCN